MKVFLKVELSAETVACWCTPVLHRHFLPWMLSHAPYFLNFLVQVWLATRGCIRSQIMMVRIRVQLDFTVLTVRSGAAGFG
jgi:hypothetical protein